MRRLAALVLPAVVALPAAAQPTDLSGTWRLDRESSVLAEDSVYAGLGGNQGVPRTLYVTQARNGTVIVGSDMNTSHARTYEPEGGSVAPLGRGGELEMRSRWESGRLVSEGRDVASQTVLREALALSDGALTVEIRLDTPDGTSTGRLVYRAATRESPCTEWPTPCRDWSAAAKP